MRSTLHKFLKALAQIACPSSIELRSVDILGSNNFAFEVNVTLIPENTYPDGHRAEKGSSGAPWLKGLRPACEVTVILSLESTLPDSQVVKIGLNCPYDLWSRSRHGKLLSRSLGG